jgi:hypothetical protein
MLASVFYFWGVGERKGDILNNLRRDDLTRTTPCRESVKDNDGVVLERLGPFLFAIQITLLVSIHLQTRCTTRGETYLLTLWTPILLAVLLNPLVATGMLLLIEFIFAYVFVVRRIARVLVVDLRKNDINFCSTPSALLLIVLRVV